MAQEEVARGEFKRQAIVRFILEDFTYLVYLTPEQLPKLRAAAGAGGQVTRRGVRPAPLRQRLPLVPLNPRKPVAPRLHPRTSLRPILTAQQWTGWSKSEAYSEPEEKK